MTNYIFLAIFLSLSVVEATTFIPISIERQIKDSDSILQGVFVASFSRKLSSGEVVTENAFKIVSSQGIKKSELRAYVNFKVLTPGGSWQDESYKVEGAPKFKKNEEVILFLKKNEHGYWIQNLSLGKYRVKKIGRESLIISSIFPYHPQMGQMELGKFFTKVATVKGENLVEYIGDYRKENQLDMAHSQYKRSQRFENRNKVKRKFASTIDVDKKSESARNPGGEAEDDLSIWWLIVLLAAMGGLSSFVIRRV